MLIFEYINLQHGKAFRIVKYYESKVRNFTEAFY